MPGLDGELSDQQLSIITSFLEQHCENNKCISTMVVYGALKDNFDMPKTRFSTLLSSAINDGILEGFSIRRGRNGGIHKEGAFDNHDLNRQRESERPKRTYNKRNNDSTNVNIGDELYTARINKASLILFVLNVLDGRLKDDVSDGVCVTIESMNFCIPSESLHILKNFIKEWKK